MLTLVEAPSLGPPRGDRRHLGDHVGEDHLAAGSDPLGGREPQAARATGELEHAVARTQICQVEQLLGDRRGALVGVVGVLVPPAGDRGPHAVEVLAELDCGFHQAPFRTLTTRSK